MLNSSNVEFDIHENTKMPSNRTVVLWFRNVIAFVAIAIWIRPLKALMHYFIRASQILTISNYEFELTENLISEKKKWKGKKFCAYKTAIDGSEVFYEMWSLVRGTMNI